MMSKSIEDQVGDCRSSFEDEDLQEYLTRVAEIEGISSPKYFIKLGTKVGDNYVGVVYTVFIEGEKNGVPVEIRTILKVPPKDEVMRLILQIPHLFTREHIFYSEIVPVFKEFLATKNKSLENIAECFFSSAVDHKEVLCLEDLKSKGFLMRDRTEQLDFVHASLALRALGRMHALSFALRDQSPEVFESKITTLEEPLFRPDVIVHSSFVDRFDALGKLVKTALSEEDPKYTERFSEYIKDALNRIGASCDGSTAEPYTVLCHGDYWMNNMLFKYGENSMEPEGIYFLDFQMSRYASPAVDISYTLFCSGNQELRKRHFDELIKIYHDSLSAYLSELGSDPKKLFPYDALLVQLEKFSVYTAGMGLLVLPVFTSRGDDVENLVPDNGDLPQLEERIHRDELFRNTLRDTYKDLIDRNYI